ncbi:hypothetical protein LL946_15725 [Knoellia locipacati]|uniref:hypothetical protein n=1 Tax=Knoellia locipacati TaxID=882824 RepID=UPI00384B115A
MTTTPPPAAAAFALSARTLCGALMGALVLIGVAMSFVLGTDSAPPTWVLLVQVGAGIAIHLLVETLGYRLPPLDPSLGDDEAANAGRLRWQSSMMLRFALTEALAIGSLVAAFVFDGGVWTYVGGALVSLALMAVHVWPGERSVTRTAEALEAGGQSSHLRETFGLPAAGPIQQR